MKFTNRLTKCKKKMMFLVRKHLDTMLSCILEFTKVVGSSTLNCKGKISKTSEYQMKVVINLEISVLMKPKISHIVSKLDSV